MCTDGLSKTKGYVEIPVFLLFFSFMFSAAVTHNLIIYRTCYVTMNYNESDCALLGTNNVTKEINDLEKIVQPDASVLLMIQSVIGSIIPAILSLFIGPWIDNHGRRPIILYVLAGNFITYLLLVFICMIPTLSPWWWLVTSFTTSIGGGETSLLMACVCYITDTSSEKNRGIRMGFFEASLTVGGLIGVVTSSYAFDAFGYTVIYSICALSTFLAILYTVILLPESVKDINEKGKLHDLFDFSLVKNMCKTCLKPRKNNGATILWMLMIVLILFLLADHADKPIFFLFLREKFFWSLEKYTLYITVSNILGIVLTLSIIYIFQKLLKSSEIFLINFAFIFSLITALLYGLSSSDIGLYIAGFTKSVGGIVRPMIKSAVSKIVPSNELGQVLTITSSAEAITPLITGPIYTYVYNKTLYTYPSTFNFITGAIHFVNIIIMISLLCIKRRKLVEEKEIPEQNALM